jgi:hypothetical protein
VLHNDEGSHVDTGGLLDADADDDMTSDQRDNNRSVHPSREEGDGSWVVAQLLHKDEGTHVDTRSLLDADTDDVDEVDPDLVTLEYGEVASNTDPSIDLCIELGSGDMIDIDEDTNIFLTIDIDLLLVIDSYASHNS